MTLNLYQKNIPELLELDRIELNEEGKAASLCFLRAQRFIEGFCVEKEITELFVKFFGNTNVNQRNGLAKQYQSMKDYVVSENKIGLILIGANLHHILIDNYPTVNNTVIDLTVRGISRILLREYFTNDEVVDLCRNTPNFHIYYKPEE